MIRAITKKLGPQDHGRRMSLKEFDHAEVQEGYLYELGRGVIVVSDIPGLRHGMQSNYLRNMLGRYQLDNPERVYFVGNGSECKILLDDFESERHPDWAIYLKPPRKKEDLWRWWVPDITIEIVSRGSEQRDYEEKREEYFAFGIKEYWIIDADKREVLVLRRGSGKWKETTFRVDDTIETKLLPGFQLDCGKLFEAADQA
jgi:Uma2 family endonuclease